QSTKTQRKRDDGRPRRYDNQIEACFPEPERSVMTTNRRAFLGAALAAGLWPAAASAIEPIRRRGRPRLQLSLAAYSYNRFLSLRGKEKPSMTLDDFIDTTAGMNVPAVELTAYYFPRTTAEYLRSIKNRCDKHKLAVSGTAVGNNFCRTDKKLLNEDLDMVR